MNRIFSLLILALISFKTLSQEVKTSLIIKRADLAFENFNFQEAVFLYKQELKKDTTAKTLKLKIAESYRKQNDHENAALWYGKVIKKDSELLSDEQILHYGQALMFSKKNDQALKWFKLYHQKKQLTLSENRISGLENFEDFYVDKETYVISEKNINSKARDFSPAYFKQGIVFISNREKESKKTNKQLFDDRVFLNLYYTKLSENGTFSKPEEFSSMLNTQYHEGPVSVYNKDKNIVLTRNYYYNKVVKRSADGINKLQILFADIKGDKWTNLRKFEHNSREYSTGHPSITEDGSLMIFSSDRPGGFGKADLYYSSYKDNSWSTPINLGPEVNTEGDEMFPFLHHTGKLYFASNGHYGLGGLDMYEANFKDNKIENIQNMGVPVNSFADDFGMIVSVSGTHGYFSTNRTSFENDDIFEFVRKPIGIEFNLIDAKTGLPLNLGKLNVSDNSGLPIALDYFGEPKRYVVLANNTLKLIVSAQGYDNYESQISTDGIKPGEIKSIVIKLNPIGVNTLTANNNTSGVVMNQSLTLGDAGGVNKDDSTTVMTSIELVDYKIENVYYDLDKYENKEEYFARLDHIVALMTKFSNVKLRLSAHTDSRGSFDYNMKLSQNRSISALEYLLKKNVDKNRIEAKYFGEYFLVNNCVNAVECDEDGHQENRRVEFELKLN